MTDVDHSSLQLGEVLGEGGQGVVRALVGRSDTVFKEYLHPSSPQFVPAALRAMIAGRGQLAADAGQVDEWAAWPVSVVVRNGAPIGFLMRRVPAAFLLEIRSTHRLADLSYLAGPPKPFWGSLRLPGAGERVALMLALARGVRVLHEHGVILGDISFGNVLWSLEPRPRVFFIDCDGMRAFGQPSVMPPADTLDWNDPTAAPGSAPDVDRDAYKLALMIQRVLLQRLDARPGEAQLGFDVDEPVRGAVNGLLAQTASAAAGHRPSVAAWVTALGGRGTRDVAMPVPRAPMDQPDPKPDLLAGRRQQRQFRPVNIRGG